MSNDAGGTARLVDSQPNGVGLGRGMPTASPDRLIRTMQGRITSWSSGMQRRYGFTRRDARGQTSHQLLRTTFPRTVQEIEATLVQRDSWSGGLIHRRADGNAVMTANHWQMHRNSGDQVASSPKYTPISRKRAKEFTVSLLTCCRHWRTN